MNPSSLNTVDEVKIDEDSSSRNRSYDELWGEGAAQGVISIQRYVTPSAFSAVMLYVREGYLVDEVTDALSGR